MYASTLFAFPLLMGPYRQKSQKVDLLLHFEIWEHSKRRKILLVLLWKPTFPMLKIPWKLFCLGFRVSNMEYKMRKREGQPQLGSHGEDKDSNSQPRSILHVHAGRITQEAGSSSARKQTHLTQAQWAYICSCLKL